MSLKYSRDSIHEREASKPTEETQLPPKAQSVDIELKDLRFAYEPGEPVLDGISHRFESGRIHAIVGASGSDKSTLLNALLGLLKLEEGQIAITLDGQSSVLEEELSHTAWLHQLSYLSQSPYFFSGTVEANLTFHDPQLATDPEKFKQLVDLVGLSEALGPTPLQFELNEGASNLSGGQQQRLAFLRAVRRDQPVLILDEATSALDEKNDIVFDLLRQRADAGANVLLITHDRDIAARCDTRLHRRRMRRKKHPHSPWSFPPWRTRHFIQRLQQLDASDDVMEVVIIDNARDQRPELPVLSKLKLVDKGQNLYVNPSWNLGVALAKSTAVCLCNDDVLMANNLLGFMRTQTLRRITGLDP